MTNVIPVKITPFDNLHIKTCKYIFEYIYECEISLCQKLILQFLTTSNLL